MKLNFTHCINIWTASPSVKFCSDTWNFFSIWNSHTFAILHACFGQFQYFFQDLENLFLNSIFFQYFQYRVGTLWTYQVQRRLPSVNESEKQHNTAKRGTLLGRGLLALVPNSGTVPRWRRLRRRHHGLLGMERLRGQRDAAGSFPGVMTCARVIVCGDVGGAYDKQSAVGEVGRSRKTAILVFLADYRLPGLPRDCFLTTPKSHSGISKEAAARFYYLAIEKVKDS